MTFTSIDVLPPPTKPTRPPGLSEYLVIAVVMLIAIVGLFSRRRQPHEEQS